MGEIRGWIMRGVVPQNPFVAEPVQALECGPSGAGPGTSELGEDTRHGGQR